MAAKHRAPDATATTSEPTQVRRPWRSTVRAVVVAVVALLPLLPDIAEALGIETVPVVASILAIVAAVQRVLALPAVDHWLSRYVGLGAQERQEYEESQ